MTRNTGDHRLIVDALVHRPPSATVTVPARPHIGASVSGRPNVDVSIVGGGAGWQLNIRGTVAYPVDLPSSGIFGDAWLTANGDVWAWRGA